MCVGVCSITVQQVCAECICEGVLQTVANSNTDLNMAQKIQRMAVCAREKDLDDQEHRKRRTSMLVKKSCKAQINRYKEQVLKPYKLQLVQAITAEGKQNGKQFCVDIQEKLEDDKFMKRLVFGDEAIYHRNGKVNKHNVHTWGEENPHATVEHVRDSPKESVFSIISMKQVYGQFF